MDKIKQFLNNLLRPVGLAIDPFGRDSANMGLEQQLRLAQEIDLARQQDIARRQQQPGGLDMATYQKMMGVNPNYQDTANDNQKLLDSLNGGGGGGGYGGGSSLQDPNAYMQNLLNQVKSSLQPAIDEWGKADARAKEFDEKNPYAFDEKQARASSEERFNPYYNAELGDYLTGVERTRQRGVQDDERLRREISADTEQYVGRSRRELDKAIESSGEGYAGAGLFFGGQRVRREGEMKVDTAESIGDYNTEQNRRIETSQTGINRLLQDQTAQSRTYQRQLNAEKETNLLTDVARQQAEYARNRELQRQQYIGFPYATGTSSIRSLLGV